MLIDGSLTQLGSCSRGDAEREKKGGTFKVVELKLSLKVQLQGNIYVKHV